MRTVCDRANMVSRPSKQYHHACQLLRVSQYLKTPFFLPCVIEDFNDDEVMLSPLHLQHLKRSQRHITYSSLGLSDKPSVGCLFVLYVLSMLFVLYVLSMLRCV